MFGQNDYASTGVGLEDGNRLNVPNSVQNPGPNLAANNAMRFPGFGPMGGRGLGIQGPPATRGPGPMMMGPMGPPFGTDNQAPLGPVGALTVHHPKSLEVEKSYISNYESTIKMDTMTVFQLNGTVNPIRFAGRIVFRRKNEEGDRLQYSEVIVQGANGNQCLTKRNDLLLSFERRTSNYEIIVDVDFMQGAADIHGGDGADAKEPKVEPGTSGEDETKRKRRK